MIRGRWILAFVAVMAWVLSSLVWLANDPAIGETAFDTFSTYNTSPGGYSQAFAYLSARLGSDRVRRLTDTTDVDEAIAPGAVIFRAVTSVAADEETRGGEVAGAPDQTRVVLPLVGAAEESWIRTGGRLVLAVSGAWGQLSTEPAECSDHKRVFPSAPDYAIDVGHCRVLAGPAVQHFHSLVVIGSGAAVARSPIGKGEIIALAMPEAFANEYVGAKEHLALLEWLAAGRSVYFDEAVHGLGRESSLLDMLFREWRLGPPTVLLLVCALLQFWRRARPAGPPDKSSADARSDAVDLVDSVGRLYERTIDREEALRLYYRVITRAAHARTGLSGEPLERYVRARTAGFDPAPRLGDVSREEFRRMLKILNDGYGRIGHADPH